MFYTSDVLGMKVSTEMNTIVTVRAISWNRQQNGYLSISNMGNDLCCYHANIVYLYISAVLQV